MLSGLRLRIAVNGGIRMSESTARAERFDLQQSNSPSWLWEPAGQPLSVRLSLDVVERMEREVVEAFRSVTSRGAEIGGLLLGSISPGPHPIVDVRAYETVDCEYSRGPL